ncbi:MAG: glycosyltransferase family 2 protein [Telluria sp.]
MRTERELPLDVTVVMPAYNRVALIGRALDSIRAQRRWPREVIVVDDASSDGTAAEVERWSALTGFPVRVERLPRNGGAAAARNHGMRIAVSTYIAFLDSDDEHLPGALERLVLALERAPDAVVAFGDATKVTPTRSISGAMFRQKVDFDQVVDPIDPQARLYRLRDPKSTFLKASLIPTCSSCFRRADALAVGGMPTEFRTGEDWLFWLKLTQRGAFVLVADDLSIAHRHPANLTHGASSANTSRDKLVGYLGLLDGSAGITLDTRQRAFVGQLVRERAALLRYQASLLGLRGYLKYALGVPGYSRKAALAEAIADPKSMLRALISSVARPSAPTANVADM